MVNISAGDSHLHTMKHISNLTGIILAGGKSSRMGTDKGLLEFNGKKLVEYPLDLFKTYCGEIIISSNNKSYADFGYRVVSDEVPGCGPLSGLASALKASSGEWNLIAGCDTPLLHHKLIERLLEPQEDYLAVVPVHRGMKEPLTALYHHTMAEVFVNAMESGQYSLHKILAEQPVLWMNTDDLEEIFPPLFANFNTPGDLTNPAHMK
jgi:molybdopterin-guanine dinucleotide biosynthesis protein A